MDELRRARERILAERSACDAASDDAFDSGRDELAMRLQAKARGLSLAIEHIDIIIGAREGS